MTWIKRKARARAAASGCACSPPTTVAGRNIVTIRTGGRFLAFPPRPDGDLGDLWRCDACGTVWKITIAGYSNHGGYAARAKHWTRAGWLTQLRHGRRPETEAERIGDGLRARIDHAERGDQ